MPIVARHGLMRTWRKRLTNASNAGVALRKRLRSSRADRMSPEIADPAKLAEAIKRISGTRILLAETEQEKTLKSQLQNASQPVTLAFGPEGGWTEDEICQFEAAGWPTATLGSTILRAETAIIAAVAIAVSELSSTT